MNISFSYPPTLAGFLNIDFFDILKNTFVELTYSDRHKKYVLNFDGLRGAETVELEWADVSLLYTNIGTSTL